MESARAISTICCSATREVAHQRASGCSRGRCARSCARVSAAMLRQLTKRPRARLAADEDVLGDRHVRGEREFLVDRDDAEALRVVRARRARSLSPANAIVPRIRACRRRRGFSAASTCRRRSRRAARGSRPAPTSKSTSSSACTPGNFLEIPRMRRSGSVVAGSLGRHGARRSCGGLEAGGGASDAPPPACSLFHFADALGLVDIVLGDGDRRQQHDLLGRLLAVAQERDQRVERAAALAARELLDGGGQPAVADRGQRFRQRVEADDGDLAGRGRGPSAPRWRRAPCRRWRRRSRRAARPCRRAPTSVTDRPFSRGEARRSARRRSCTCPSPCRARCAGPCCGRSPGWRRAGPAGS